jgi:hypothetical protein
MSREPHNSATLELLAASLAAAATPLLNSRGNAQYKYTPSRLVKVLF